MTSVEWHSWFWPPAPPAPPAPPPATDGGPWQVLTVTTPNGAHHGWAATGLIGGKLYMAGGGVGQLGNGTSGVWTFNPATSTWAQVGSLPAAFGRFGAVGVIGTKLYMTWRSDAPGRMWAYDTATNTTAELAGPPAAGTSQYDVAAVLDGKLYQLGGQNPYSGGNRAECYRYDPATNTWATLAPMPDGGRLAHSVAVMDGRLYVVGGFSATTVTATLFEYDPTTNTWATKAPMPYGRQEHATIALDGKLYVFGGMGQAAGDTSSSSWSTSRDTVYVWDRATNAWTVAPPMPGKRKGHSAEVINGAFYLVGGAYPDNYAVWKYAAPVPATAEPPAPVRPAPLFTLDPARTEGLLAWSATHGRPDAVSNTSASSCTLTLGASWSPVAPVLGERFRLALPAAELEVLGLTAADAPRFTGEVTDVVTDPATGLHNVTAMGRWARAGRDIIDGRGFPRETEGPRIDRILRRIDQKLDIGTLDAGEVTMLPAPKERTSAVQLVEQLTASSAGQLIEQRSGALDWHSAEHRRGAVVRLTLTAAEVFADGFTWQQHVGALVNDVTVTYGRDGKSVRVRDGESIDERGPYPLSVTTDLVDEGDAYSLGSLIVSRRGVPTWQLPVLQVDLLRTITDPVRRRVAATLRHGDRIKVTGLPPSPDKAKLTELQLYVEGTTELAYRSPGKHDTDARKAWRLQLAVAQTHLAGVTLRYKDVPDAVTTTTVRQGLSYLDLGRIENTTDLT